MAEFKKELFKVKYVSRPQSKRWLYIWFYNASYVFVQLLKYCSWSFQHFIYYYESSDKLHRITYIILVKTCSKSSHSLSGSTLISLWDLFWDLTSTYMILVISLANSCSSAVHHVSCVCSVWQAAAPRIQPVMATNGHQRLDNGTFK